MRLLSLQVGNIVRVPILAIGDAGAQAVYFRIVQNLGGGKFRGRCDDPYLMEQYTLILNGEDRVFGRRHVMEVPLDWPGNERLRKVAVLRHVIRCNTGMPG